MFPRKRYEKDNHSGLKVFRSSPLIVGSFCIAGAVMAEDNPAAKSSSVSEKDKTFMKKAAKGGMMEVAMGKTAEQNAQSEDVKSFGEANGHRSQQGERRTEIDRRAKGCKRPTKEHTGKWSSDKAYIDAMVKDHEKDLAEFQEEAKTGSDPEVKKFAEDTAKVVQEHLDLAKETQSKLQ